MIIDIVILCPVEVEFKIIRKILSNPTSTTIKSNNLSFECGQIQGSNSTWNVAIIEPDFSVSSFELKTNVAIESLRPKYVFLAGVAGGIKDSRIGDIVIGTMAYDYESGKETSDIFVARPKVVVNQSQELLTLARRIERKINNDHDLGNKAAKFYFGPIASGKKVIAATSSNTYKIIKRYYNDTQAVEMESYAFAVVASKTGGQYLNIRGISDLIDQKAASDAEACQEEAVRRVANFLKILIEALPPKQLIINYSTKISFTKQYFKSIAWRTYTTGMLELGDDFLKLNSKEGETLLRNIYQVNHIKMPGDLFKNWVQINYMDNSTKSVIYVSDSIPLGLGYWLGGSKTLFTQLKELIKKQVSTQNE